MNDTPNTSKEHTTKPSEEFERLLFLEGVDKKTLSVVELSLLFILDELHERIERLEDKIDTKG